MNPYLLPLCAALLAVSAGAHAMEEILDEELAEFSGEGIAFALENVAITSTTDAAANIGRGYTPVALGGPDTGTGTGTSPRIIAGMGLGWEFVADQGNGAMKWTDIELGDPLGTGARGRFGNTNFDDPAMWAVVNNVLTYSFPGRLSYDANKDGDFTDPNEFQLVGPDRVPSRTGYDFVDPNAGCSGIYAGNCYASAMYPRGNTSGSIKYVPPVTLTGYIFRDKGLVYRLPHEPLRNGNLSFSSGQVYTALAASLLSPTQNIDLQFDQHLKATSAINRVSYVPALNYTTQTSDGYHRMGTLRVSGLHSGRTLEAAANAGGLNNISLRAGGYAQRLYLPDFACVSNAAGTYGYLAAPGYAAMFSCGANTDTDLDAFGNAIYGKRVAGGADATQQSYWNPAPSATGGVPWNAAPPGHWDYVRDGSNKPILRGGIRGTLEINYLRYDELRFSRSTAMGDSANWPKNIPAGATNIGGAAGVYERELWLTDLEIRDVRVGTLKSDPRFGTWSNPAVVTSATNMYNGNWDGSYAAGDYRSPSYYDNGQANEAANTAFIGAADQMPYYWDNNGNYQQIANYVDNTCLSGCQDWAPLSLTFFDDPHRGRVLELFVPMHDSRLVGNATGRVTWYSPFIGPENGGRCCGANIIDGIAINYLNMHVYLD